VGGGEVLLAPLLTADLELITDCVSSCFDDASVPKNLNIKKEISFVLLR
jgi:hypothetical protein